MKASESVMTETEEALLDEIFQIYCNTVNRSTVLVNKKVIPERAKETIDNYVKHRFKPGGFITAVLANDLAGTFGKADINNRHALFDIVAYVYNNVPHTLCGSYDAVERHLGGKNESK